MNHPRVHVALRWAAAALTALAGALPASQTAAAAAPSTAAAASAAAAAAASTADPADPTATARAHALFERSWDESARLYPEFATYRGDHRYDDKLTDASPEAIAARDRWTLELLEQARAISRAALSPADVVSLDLFIAQQQRFAERQAFPGWRSMSLDALGGVHSELAELLQISPNRSRAQVQQMLARLAAFPRRIEQEIANLRRGMTAGWVSPREVLLRVLAQIDAQLTPKVEDSPYWPPFARIPASVPEAERSELQAAARTALAQQVYPALRALRRFIADEYLPQAPAEGALRQYPDGARVYAMLVRHNTTTELSPQQIHDMGLAELTRLRAEMDKVRAEVRFEGDFATFAQHLYTDARFFHSSPQALLTGYREIAKRIDAELPRLFAELPRAPYGVVGMPGFMGPDRAEYYQGPAADGSRAGFFFANLAGYKTRPTWAMETLVAHEAMPGHHLQIARAMEIAGQPHFRRNGFGYTAYTEGWALYAETLGFQLGLFQDPYSRYGHLMWQAFRAARLVVDTGMHALGWSRQRCIDFMVERTGVGRAFVTAEIDRYSSMPGQALGYMVGRMKIEQLRDRAQARLGPRFDLRRFHNAVLDQGALPLTVLERLVDEWIDSELAARRG